MPSYLRAIDVGLTPYADSAFNRASFRWNSSYLAAGRQAVSTNLPAVRWLDTDLVATARGPEAFADAVQRCLVRAGTPAVEQRCRASRSAIAGRSGRGFSHRPSVFRKRTNRTGRIGRRRLRGRPFPSPIYSVRPEGAYHQWRKDSTQRVVD